MGVIASIARALAVTNVALPVTEARLTLARSLFPDYADEIPGIERRFAESPAVTLLHVIPGALLLILGLLQFSPRIRDRHLNFHRWSGRVVVILAIFAGLTGLWIGVVLPYSSNERLPSAVFGALFLMAAAMGIAAIRRGDVARHREWMIRLYAVAVGIVVIRLVGPPIILLLTPTPFREIIGLTFWAGWGLSVMVAELWIRSTREYFPLTAASPSR